METQVFDTYSSFIYTALISRIFLDVFSFYNLKMSHRFECTIVHSGLWDIFIIILLMSYNLSQKKTSRKNQSSMNKGWSCPKDLSFHTGLDIKQLAWLLKGNDFTNCIFPIQGRQFFSLFSKNSSTKQTWKLFHKVNRLIEIQY